MRKITIVAVILSGMLFSSTPAANACGGTLTSISAGVKRMHEFAKDHRARILIFANPAASTTAPPPAVLKDYLNMIGHQSEIVYNLADAEKELKDSSYDAVITSLVDAARLSTKTATIVLLSKKLPKAEKASAEKQYRYLIKDPSDGMAYLGAIYKIMNLKAYMAQHRV